jgi:putative SOS response-associated peptidase YedK
LSYAYRLDAVASDIAAGIGAKGVGDVWQGGSVAPGSYAPVVVGGQDRTRRIVPRQWGVPSQPGHDHTVTHVRNLTSPFWIGTLRHTQFRCLVPVTRFHGAVTGSGGQRRWISVRSSSIFAFAGIWRDSEVPSYAVLTTEGNVLMASAKIMTMPVILHPEDYSEWLGADWKQAQRLVSPYPSQLMHIQAE